MCIWFHSPDIILSSLHTPASPRVIAEDSFPALEELSNKAIKEKQPFLRLEMTKADLLKMFEYNEFKQRIINERLVPWHVSSFFFFFDTLSNPSQGRQE
jgi:threonyl-tRNA synthetase